MKISRNKLFRMCVLSLSIVSILSYSTKVCGIHMVQAAEISEDEISEGTDSYIVIAENRDAVRQVEKDYKEASTLSETADYCMEQGNVTVCDMTAAEAEELQKQDDILRVEKDCLMKANGSIKNRRVKKKKQSELKEEWNMAMVKTDASDTKNSSEKVKVAVIDSGVDFGNDVELQDYIDLVPGYEDCVPYYTDITGHGSSVAGIIAAGNNDIGITGINPNVQLYSARVLDEKNVAPVSRVIEAIYWAMEHDVNIINMSFGMKEDSKALHNAIKDAYDAGILLVAAAGNNGTVEYPAAYEEVIAVGAVDSRGIVCENSARGEEIELVAPGEKVASTGAFQGTLVCSGTSMAAPHVTGIASLLWEKDLSVSADFIRALLGASANGYGAPDAYGNGLVDYEYAEKIYETFKADYQSNVNGADSYENETAVQTIEANDYVEGTWEGTQHKNLITNTGSLSAANVATIKEGAVYPDKNESGLKGMGANPGFHGSGNYVVNAIYLSYMARDGNVEKASKYFSQDILSTYQTSFDVMYNKLLNCKNRGDITNKYFWWGIAIHSLSDSFAHNAMVQNPRTGKWYTLVHEEDANSSSTGYLADADNPYIARARFDSAQESVNMGLYELLNGNAWTFRVYQHEAYFNTYSNHTLDGYEYCDYILRMKKLFYFAKEIDYGANYSYILKQATYGNVK